VDVDPTELLADAIERARNVTVGFMFLSADEAPSTAQAGRVEKLRFFRTEPPNVHDGGRLAPAGEGVRLLGRFSGVVPPVDEVLAVADSGGFFTVLPDPDGTIRPLIHIDDWDFNWQGNYTFAQSIPLPAGTRIDMVAAFDNSAENLRQPSRPPRPVSWGEGTTDEMAIVFLGVTADGERIGWRPR